eukprot:4442486-Pyramimonas_sp.AAC.1
MDFYSYQQHSQNSPASTAFVAGLYAENDDENMSPRPTPSETNFQEFYYGHGAQDHQDLH